MLQIMTNMASLGAQRGVAGNQKGLEKSLNELSSGSRINKAADDAAGLALSKEMNMDLRSAAQADRNTNDAISLVQIADGSFTELSGIVTRLREVGMMASSDTIQDEERRMLNREVVHLRAEMDRITESTRMVSRKLLNGQEGDVQIQVGIFGDMNNDKLKINLKDFDTRSANLGMTNVDFTTKEQAQKSIGDLDRAMQNLSARRATIGAIQNRLVSSIDNLGVQRQNVAQSQSTITDADIAVATANAAKGQIIQNAGVASLAQANQNQNLALKLI